ncbi:MAG: FAD-dependent oxidoreductase [Candidatus Omnitrophota bacterium]
MRNCSCWHAVWKFVAIVLILLFLSVMVAQQMRHRTGGKDRPYDVVIIGAGLSGLSAANVLKGRSVLVLEKDNKTGGRVLTRYKDGIAYELGATCRYAGPEVSGSHGFEAKFFVETGKIAVAHQGTVYYCDQVSGCIDQLGLPLNELAKISRFSDGKCRDGLLDASGFSKDSLKVLNSFFRLIHPGEMSDYTCARQKDLFEPWPIEYYFQGNRWVVDTLSRALSSRIELKAEVVSVEDSGKDVMILYRQGDILRKVFSRTAIVAVPAPVAKKILSRISPRSSSFLDSVKYGKFTVVVMALKGADFGNFRYLFTTDALSSAIFAMHRKDKDTTVLYMYYGDKESRQLSGATDAEVIDMSIDALRQLNIRPFTRDDILFTDIKRWESGGTIISDALLRNHRVEGSFQPSERVFLAGDYVYSGDAFPYGMAPAVLAGEETAARVVEYLRKEHKGGPERN